MAAPQAVTAQDFEQEVLKADLPVLVDFWAPWCGPCRAMAPVLESLAQRSEGKLKLAKLNVDDHAAVAARYNIQSIPTLLVFQGGEVKATLIGFMDERKLWEELSSKLNL